MRTRKASQAAEKYASEIRAGNPSPMDNAAYLNCQIDWLTGYAAGMGEAKELAVAVDTWITAANNFRSNPNASSSEANNVVGLWRQMELALVRFKTTVGSK